MTTRAIAPVAGTSFKTAAPASTPIPSALLRVSLRVAIPGAGKPGWGASE